MQVNIAAVSQLWIHRTMTYLARLLAADAALKQHADQILHVRSETVWAAPLDTIRRIYDMRAAVLARPGNHSGPDTATWELSAESAARISQYVQEHPPKGSAAIEYSSEVLGLDEAQVARDYASVLQEYQRRFLQD